MTFLRRGRIPSFSTIDIGPAPPRSDRHTADAYVLDSSAAVPWGFLMTALASLSIGPGRGTGRANLPLTGVRPGELAVPHGSQFRLGLSDPPKHDCGRDRILEIKPGPRACIPIGGRHTGRAVTEEVSKSPLKSGGRHSRSESRPKAHISVVRTTRSS